MKKNEQEERIAIRRLIAKLGASRKSDIASAKKGGSDAEE